MGYGKRDSKQARDAFLSLLFFFSLFFFFYCSAYEFKSQGCRKKPRVPLYGIYRRRRASPRDVLLSLSLTLSLSLFVFLLYILFAGASRTFCLVGVFLAVVAALSSSPHTSPGHHSPRTLPCSPSQMADR